MNNQLPILYICLLGMLIASCNAPFDNIQKKNAPNVILIVVDDWGWKDAGFLGSSYYETPNLDQLAKEGMVFTHAYAGAANCAPSRACMLSGRNTPWHGIYTVSPSARGHEKTRKLIPIRNTRYLADSVRTLHRMMKDAGYVTSNFGKWHLGEDPTRQGVDVNVGGSGKGNPGRNGYFSPYKIDFIQDGPAGEYLTDRLTHEAMAFMDTYRDTTFFLYLPFYTVHTPIMGKPGWVEHYKGKPGQDGHTNQEYAAMISSMDENIGRIIQQLKDTDLYDNSLIILTSDNGGLQRITKQYPLRAGKGSYYEGGIRVPFVVKWKDQIPANRINSNTISHLDIYPTLQQIVQPKEKIDSLVGRDLMPLFTGKQWTDRSLYFHFPVYLQASSVIEGLRDPLFRTRPGAVIIDGSWKLHHYFEDDGIELYDLKMDVSENVNLAATKPDIRDRLYRKLDQWRILNRASIPKVSNPLYDAPFETKQIKLKLDNVQSKIE